MTASTAALRWSRGYALIAMRRPTLHHRQALPHSAPPGSTSAHGRMADTASIAPMPSSTQVARKQCNVRLPPALIEAADVRRAALGLSRDRYVEQLIEADTRTETTEQELVEAAELAARIRGDIPTEV
jgi:hypothetical protein